MKHLKLIIGIVVGVCIGSAVVFGTLRSKQPHKHRTTPTQFVDSTSNGFREYQLSFAQIEAIQSTVDAYLQLVKEKKWDQAQEMNSLHPSRAKEFRANWESFGTISGFKNSEPSAMYYPVNPDPVVVKVLYTVFCTRAPAGSVPVYFRVVERSGKWVVSSQHRLRSRP